MVWSGTGKRPADPKFPPPSTVASRGPRSNTEVVISTERRYTETEFALILRKALELEERAPVRGGEGGLTLAEIQAVAREVGVDPELVARAASQLPDEGSSTAALLLGGRARSAASFRSSRILTAEEMGRAVSAAREVLGQHGEVDQELTGITWKSVGDVTQSFVTLRPDETGTEIQVRLDRSGAMVLTWFLSAILFVFVGAALGNTLAPEGVLGGILYFLAFLMAGLATGRTVWSLASTAAAARFQRLVDAVAREVIAPLRTPSPAGDALPPPATEGARPPGDGPPAPATGHPGPGPGAGTA